MRRYRKTALGLGAVALALFAFSPASRAETTVRAPGVNVQQGPGGVIVDAPSAHVRPGMVVAPGTRVKTPSGVPSAPAMPGGVVSPGVAVGPGGVLAPGVEITPDSILAPGVAITPEGITAPGVAIGGGN